MTAFFEIINRTQVTKKPHVTRSFARATKNISDNMMANPKDDLAITRSSDGGLKIGIDKISEKGKLISMLTASGTTALLKKDFRRSNTNQPQRKI